MNNNVIRTLLLGMLKLIRRALEDSIYEEPELLTIYAHYKALRRKIETAEWEKS